MTKDIKDIDKEINRLLEIKERVLHLREIITNNKFIRLISLDKFNELLHDEKLDENLIYFQVEPEVGQYIEGYIE